MTLYRHYSLPHILLRRLAVIIAAVLAFPFMLFYRQRARFYSYLHRCWCKTSSQPVWLTQAEMTGADFF